MNKTKSLSFMILCITAIKANKTTETVHIDIDLSWNSKCQNLTTPPFVYDSCAKRDSSTDLQLNEVTAMANNSNKYGSRTEATPTFSTSSAVLLSAARVSMTESSTKSEIYSTDVNSWLATCSSHTKNWVLSSGMRQLNDSLWATGSLRPTRKVSSTPFSGTASANRYSVPIMVLCFIIDIIFYT